MELAEVPTSLLENMFSASWLMKQKFPPTEYVVPGVIPEGLSLLVAAPKIGKSWLVLGLGVAAASGGWAFGHLSVPRRPVLYLALEDGPKRLQSRLESIGVTDPPADLHFMTKTQSGLMIPTIREFMETNADQKPLVVLDTLGKVMPPALAQETTYSRDYRVTGALKAIVDDTPGSSLIAVHHTRKAESSDFLDAVSGTNGIAGAADSILVLRRDREDANAVLHVTSRDAKEGSYGLNLDPTGNWMLNGTSLDEAAQAARTSTATSGVGDRMAEIVSFVDQSTDGVRRADVATAFGMAPGDAGRYLARATDAGRIRRAGLGLYMRVSHLSPVSPLPEDTRDTRDTHTDDEGDETC